MNCPRCGRVAEEGYGRSLLTLALRAPMYRCPLYVRCGWWRLAWRQWWREIA